MYHSELDEENGNSDKVEWRESHSGETVIDRHT